MSVPHEGVVHGEGRGGGGGDVMVVVAVPWASNTVKFLRCFSHNATPE